MNISNLVSCLIDCPKDKDYFYLLSEDNSFTYVYQTDSIYIKGIQACQASFILADAGALNILAYNKSDNFALVTIVDEYKLRGYLELNNQRLLA